MRISNLSPGIKLNASRIAVDDFYYTKTKLLQSSIFAEGALSPGWLDFSFYNLDGQMLGAKFPRCIIALTVEHCTWDVTAHPGSSELNIQLSPDKVNSFLDSAMLCELNEYARSHAIGKTCFFQLSPSAEYLRTKLEFLLTENSSGSSSRSWITRWSSADFYDLLSETIAEVLSIGKIDPSDIPARRYELAKSIEKDLWDETLIITESANLSQFAKKYGVNRRTIHNAVVDVYGVSFIELKRAIRLHQARSHLSRKSDRESLTQVALAYEFGHAGRFAKFFKNLFGVYPSGRNIRSTSS